MNILEHNGFFAQIMKAPRLKGEQVHSLPPGSPIDVYPVDSFNEPLPHWMQGQGNFVVPVDPDWGLWFDWRKNDHLNTSVLPTIKGMNPITGQKTEGYGLEQYKNSCPIHNSPFKHGRYCEECNYTWPPQNYVSYPNTLWWDGFRTSDGKVRQFFFTEDIEKSVPEQVMGKHNTVPAFGFAFVRTKNPRVRQHDGSRGVSLDFMVQEQQIKIGDCATTSAWPYTKPGYYTMSTTDITDKAYAFTPDKGISTPDINKILRSLGAPLSATAQGALSNNGDVSSQLAALAATANIYQCASQINPVKEVGVGAGSEIRQDLYPDNLPLTDWMDAPASVMRLYFIFMPQFELLKKQGFKDMTGNREGFLHGKNVG